MIFFALPGLRPMKKNIYFTYKSIRHTCVILADHINKFVMIIYIIIVVKINAARGEYAIYDIFLRYNFLEKSRPKPQHPTEDPINYYYYCEYDYLFVLRNIKRNTNHLHIHGNACRLLLAGV